MAKGERAKAEQERAFRIPTPLYERLKKRAAAEHRSINGQMLVALTEHLEGSK